MAISWSAVAASVDGLDGSGEFVTQAGGTVEVLATRSGFRATPGELLRTSDRERVHIVAGIGEAPDRLSLRKAAAELGRAVRHCERVEVVVPTVMDLDATDTARAIIEGIVLGTYQFVPHKTDPRANRLASVALVHADTESVQRAIAIAEPIAAGVTLARDLANETPARMTASRLADVAVSVASERGLDVEIWDEARVIGERLGCLLAVNAGSSEPPRVIRLDFAPDSPRAHVVLVGKGITFDSGGLSLKQPARMYDMKGDMGGAAAVIGAMSACVALDVSVRVTGLIMATDNLPGPGATKPGEIVHARNGTTVEILDTDAEGRLVLADGLCLAAELEPDAIIDIATLTGYGRVLGSHFTPVMSNDDALRSRIVDASEAAGEATWPLPLPEAFVTALESPWADLRNIPDPDDAGTIAPGVFLRHFVNDRKWAHLDIGETGFATKHDGDITKGCTGAMVRTLCELLRTWESSTS
jgi:leucyl aminopeptidase